MKLTDLDHIPEVTDESEARFERFQYESGALRHFILFFVAGSWITMAVLLFQNVHQLHQSQERVKLLEQQLKQIKP